MTERLLDRIKALFAPRRSPAPEEQEIRDRVTAVEAIPELPEQPTPEPVAELPEEPTQEPVAVAEEPTEPAAPPVEPEPAPVVTAESEAVIEAPTVAPSAPGSLTLRLETERGPRSTFEVSKSGATIGRGPESTIQLPDISVSRKHAKISYRQGSYWLRDLGSMGGTWIDGTKLAAPRRVAAGQTIDIGACRLKVVSVGAEEDAEMPDARPLASRR